MLPLLVLRRLDAVLARAKGLPDGPGTQALLRRAADRLFFNTSPLTFTTLLNDDRNVAASLRAYINAFSPDAVEVLEQYRFDDKITRLDKCWRWVHQARASAEAGRVLAPGGILGLIWNDRDVSDPWVSEMSVILSAADQGRDADADAEPVPHPPFGPFERLDVRWENETTIGGVVDMIASRSYAIGVPADRRAELQSRIRTHADEWAAPDGRLTVPCVTRAYKAE